MVTRRIDGNRKWLPKRTQLRSVPDIKRQILSSGGAT